jgi:hypothetical protein
VKRIMGTYFECLPCAAVWVNLPVCFLCGLAGVERDPLEFYDFRSHISTGDAA